MADFFNFSKNFQFLLDCGWDETNSSRLIDNLRRHGRQIDAILISHPSVLHLGLLPYAVAQLGINCPIYMTIPTCKLGQMFMYDITQSKTATEDFDLFSLDDIEHGLKITIAQNYAIFKNFKFKKMRNFGN